MIVLLISLIIVLIVPPNKPNQLSSTSLKYIQLHDYYFQHIFELYNLNEPNNKPNNKLILTNIISELSLDENIQELWYYIDLLYKDKYDVNLLSNHIINKSINFISYHQCCQYLIYFIPLNRILLQFYQQNKKYIKYGKKIYYILEQIENFIQHYWKNKEILINQYKKTKKEDILKSYHTSQNEIKHLIQIFKEQI